MAKIVELIETEVKKGLGGDLGSPVRIVTQYWTKEGELLFEKDPDKGISKAPRKYALLIFLFLSFSAPAQYVDFSVDPNKYLGLIDNPRTEYDHKGSDVDLELGVIENNFGYYIFYGRFPDADYQNYGFGVDYYLLQGHNFSLAVGPQFTTVLRKYPVGLERDTSWGANFGYAGRVVGILWLFNDFGISGRFQYQRRPDIGIGILEGSVGIRYNL